MSRRARLPDTRTPQQRELWRQVKADEKARLRAKQKRYGLRSLTEARLFCAPPTRNGNVRWPRSLEGEGE